MEPEDNGHVWVHTLAIILLVFSIGNLLAGLWREVSTASIVFSVIGIISSGFLLSPRRAKN